MAAQTPLNVLQIIYPLNSKSARNKIQENPKLNFLKYRKKNGTMQKYWRRGYILMITPKDFVDGLKITDSTSHVSIIDSGKERALDSENVRSKCPNQRRLTQLEMLE